MKVGDYVRTKYGIAKIIDISCGEDLMFDNDNIFDEDEQNIYRYDKPSMYSNWADNNIIKSSPNIIDLIEVGDYVNGSKVIDIAPTPKRAIYIEDIQQHLALIPITNINRVLTKEQFESMEYKVGD